jgi:Putative DNA-binding domain
MRCKLLDTIQSQWIETISKNGRVAGLEDYITEMDFDGISVYKESSYTMLFNHLKTTFPLCIRFVGDSFWYGLLHRYIHDTPCKHVDINQYGNTLPQYINEFNPAKQVPCLVSLCELEWVWHDVANKKLLAVFDYESFSKISSENLNKLRFHLNPTLTIIKSQYPIYQVWESNFNKKNRQIDIDNNAESLIIFHNQHEPCLMQVSDIEVEFLEAICNSNTWKEAANSLLAYRHDIKIELLINKALVNHWITHFSLEEI